MKKLLFIYNPNAGTGALGPSLADVLDIFVKAEYEVTVYPTQKYQDALFKTLSYSGDYDLVVCSGGDGTLNEVVNGMVAREKKVPIGYIPTGTTNDFGKSMGISRNVLRATDVAVRGIPFSCDVGRFNDRFFTYVAAFGIFTDVPYETAQDVKNIIGHLAYILEGAKRVFNVPSISGRVICNELVIEDDFVLAMVTNSHSVGGFKGLTGEGVAFNDGLFEVLLVKRPQNPKELNDMISALVLKQNNSDVVSSFKASRVEFEFEEEVRWTLDGEFGGNHTRVVIENKKQLLEFMVPEETHEVLSG